VSVQRTAPARQASLREHNLALVLGEVAAAGPASRARIAAATGLTKATVSSLVETLLDARLLAEVGVQDGPRVGRPASALALSPGGPVGIGVEVNVDYVAACTVDLAGTVLSRETVVGDLRGLAVPAALDRAAAVLRRAVDGATAGGRRVAGVTVAVPGLVEAGGTGVLVAPNLGWRDVEVLAELARRTELAPQVRLRLDNEANLAALAELWRGGHRDAAGRPLDTFVHVSGEVGVGAGIVLRGELLRGRHGFAGEIGHVPVPGSDAPCACGSRGCLERVAGQDAIARAAGLPPASGADAVAAAAATGDARAADAAGAAGTALGVALAGVLNLLDVDTVVLGGGYARLAPWLAPAVTREVRARVLAVGAREVSVVPGRLAADAAVLGAADSVVRAVIADPAAHLTS
jgi:predicted NBD/HSP70 family sugar kinase